MNEAVSRETGQTNDLTKLEHGKKPQPEMVGSKKIQQGRVIASDYIMYNCTLKYMVQKYSPVFKRYVFVCALLFE